MAKRRGNPNWGRPEGINLPGPGTTGFEEVTGALGLSPEGFEGSTQLKEWVRRNKDHKYVPPDLLKLWGFEVKSF